MFGIKTRQEIKRLRGLLDRTKEQRLTRRASGMLPASGEWKEIKNTSSRHVNFRSLFLSFEGNKSTCCIHISSPKEKSRASLILFRGRVLACVYGKRDLPYYTYGQDAFESVRIDLAHPDTQFTVQTMSEDLALASAAIFQGRYKNQPQDIPVKDFIAEAYNKIVTTKRAGCILVRDKDLQTRFIIYLFDGELFNFYSYKQGWLKASYEKAMKHIMRESDLQVQAFMLTINTIDELFDLTFSPSNVANGKMEKRFWTSEGSLSDPLQAMAIHAQPPTLRGTLKFSAVDAVDQHRLDIACASEYAIREALSGHSHMVDPLH